MIDTAMLSKRYSVRRLDESDADVILRLCSANTQFYEYCEAEPSKEQILSDLRVTPPGMDSSSKHYVGFYKDDDMVAIMDLIDGYPKQESAYIGFFMMNRAFQGRKIGTSIIGEALDYLKSIGKKNVRLAIDKDNPQSTHFWAKNGFKVIKEVDRNGWTALVAERIL